MSALVTFTPNPALDITYTVGTLTLGASHRVEDFVYRAGGKGLNTASVLAQMHLPARAVGFFTSPAYLADLEKREKDLEGFFTFQSLPMPFNNRSSVALVTEGDATVFNEAAPDYGERDETEITRTWEEVWERALELDWVEAGSIVSINGSFARHTPAGVLTQLIQGLHAKECWVLVDTSGSYLLEAARAGADCLKPNVHELKEATGMDSLAAGARALLGQGAKSLLVSAGKDGLAYVSAPAGVSGEELSTVSLPVSWAIPGVTLEGNPTGAGDAAVAGFMSAKAEGLPIREALARAVSWSAAAVPAAVAGVLETSLIAEITAKITYKSEEWS